MTTVSFKNLQIHVALNKIANGAWMAVATIEDPATAETAPVALPDVHRSPRAAVQQVLAQLTRQRPVHKHTVIQS